MATPPLPDATPPALHGPPWDESVERVVLLVSGHLHPDGRPSAGGRERFVTDLARVVREDWKRPVVVVQKATRAFETTDPTGLPVIGLKVGSLGVGSDPLFGYLASRFVGPRDGLVHAGGETSWPFFGRNSKAVQHGIWWDGPFGRAQLLFQRVRLMAMMRAVRSLLCVDTNFINWLRGQGAEGLALCQKCAYVPNYADTSAIATGDPDRPMHRPPHFITARRWERKRGTHLFIQALAMLRDQGLDFRASIFTVHGLDVLGGMLDKLGLRERVLLAEESLNGILRRYADADIAVVPTVWSEGTSLAAVEAICAGLPVVATPVGGLGNLVVPGFNGVLVPPAPEHLAQGIAQLCDEPRWRRMRANCLSMRPALALEGWRARVLEWLRS